MNAAPPSWLAGLEPGSRAELLGVPRAKRLAAFGRNGNLADDDALTALARASGLELVASPAADPANLPLFPARIAHDFHFIPITGGSDPEILHLATSWPPDEDVTDWLALFCSRRL